MTREQAIKMISAELTCLTRDVSGTDEECNREQCNDCILNYEKGNMGERKQWLYMAIEALKQRLIATLVTLEKMVIVTFVTNLRCGRCNICQK